MRGAAASLACGAILVSGCADEAPRAPATVQDTEVAASAPVEALPKATITLFFPSSSDDALVTESREIVDTARPAERGTQVLVALLAGPSTEGARAAVPEGTTLRQLWIGRNGVAWADFSAELASGLAGGSADELLAVYAIVDSLVANVPQIHRVGLLVEGRERDTLAGHVDVRRPLSPDRAVTTAVAGAVE